MTPPNAAPVRLQNPSSRRSLLSCPDRGAAEGPVDTPVEVAVMRSSYGSVARLRLQMDGSYRRTASGHGSEIRYTPGLFGRIQTPALEHVSTVTRLRGRCGRGHVG